MLLFMNKPKENCPKVTVRVNPSELTLMKTYLFVTEFEKTRLPRTITNI